jgi:hypothetical protein
LSAIGFDMFVRIFATTAVGSESLTASPSFIEPSALPLVEIGVQLSLPLSFLPPLPKPGSVYHPNAAAPAAAELSPSRSPCHMHMPTTTPCELLPSKVISRSPSLRIGTSLTPLS